MSGRVTTDTEILAGYVSDESGLEGRADGLVRPVDTAEVSRIVRDCRDAKRPLLPQGLRTATTGGAVPFGGWVMNTERMVGVLDIDRDRRTADVLPGTITADLKAAVAAEGLYYPPDPTSEKECTIGGNAASNASGARSFRWGMTVDWIEGLEVVTGGGEVLWLERRYPDKNTVGPRCFHQPLDVFIGSEGILGMITRVRVRLIDDPGPFAGTFLYFPDLNSALSAAVHWRRTRTPRCVELFDGAALDLIRDHPRAVSIPAGAGAMLFTEWDLGDRDVGQALGALLPEWRDLGVMVEDTVVAADRADQERLRELRHHVPSSCNELAAAHHRSGGLKVSTEFCVPPDHILEMMAMVERHRSDADLMVRYGHIGNGHPHIFMRGRNPDEVRDRKVLAHRLCRRAVELGGTVAGEHGIGRTRRDFLHYMFSTAGLEALAGLKRAYDPNWILAPGNVLPDPRGIDDGVIEIEA